MIVPDPPQVYANLLIEVTDVPPVDDEQQIDQPQDSVDP
jgi:hypothetical protein